MRVDAINVGFVFGALLALWHACWSALVALGWAQHVLNFVLWAHFISLPIRIEPFAIGRALILVGIAFGAGFVTGSILAIFWNVTLRRWSTTGSTRTRHSTAP